MELETRRARVAAPLEIDYLERKPGGKPSSVILLLHGYGLAGAQPFKKLAAHCPQDSWVIAPNGPFPIPERRLESHEDGRYRLGFGWYFYDSSRDEYLIDMNTAIEALVGLLGQLGALGLPLRIAGFSQGGYLAPFLAARLPGVVQVMGLAAEYLVDELRETGAAWPPPYRVDAILGGRDEVVPLERARAFHESALKLGARGELVVLPDAGHRIAPEMATGFARLIRL
jgi:predicted esterase